MRDSRRTCAFMAAGCGMTDRLLDAIEVAERLHVPVSWVRESTRSGAMPSVELGRYRVVGGGGVARGVRDARPDDRAARQAGSVTFGQRQPGYKPIRRRL